MLLETGPQGYWVLVFRQTVPFYFNSANDWSQAKSLNPDDDTQPNYSILSNLETYRSLSDGLFKFKLAYPQDNPGQENIWKQSSNPVVATSGGVENYESIETPWTEKAWGGLERNFGSNSQNSFLDGSMNNWWFFAIAASIAHQGGIPGYTAGAGLQQVELYVWQEAGDYFAVATAPSSITSCGKSKVMYTHAEQLLLPVLLTYFHALSLICLCLGSSQSSDRPHCCLHQAGAPSTPPPPVPMLNWQAFRMEIQITGHGLMLHMQTSLHVMVLHTSNLISAAFFG